MQISRENGLWQFLKNCLRSPARYHKEVQKTGIFHHDQVYSKINIIILSTLGFEGLTQIKCPSLYSKSFLEQFLLTVVLVYISTFRRLKTKF